MNRGDARQYSHDSTFLGTRLAPKTLRRGMHVIAWGGIFLHGVHEADFFFLLQYISAPDSSAQQFHQKTHGQRVF